MEIPKKSIGCGFTRVHFDFWGNIYLGSTTKPPETNWQVSERLCGDFHPFDEGLVWPFADPRQIDDLRRHIVSQDQSFLWLKTLIFWALIPGPVKKAGRRRKTSSFIMNAPPSPEISLAVEKLSQNDQSLQSHPKFVSILMNTSSFMHYKLWDRISSSPSSLSKTMGVVSNQMLSQRCSNWFHIS